MEVSNTQDYLVSFRVASFIRELGFHVPTRDYYHAGAEEIVYTHYGNGMDYNNLVDYGYATVSAPTLQVVQKWFREKKDFEVYAIPISKGIYKVYCVQYKDGDGEVIYTEGGFSSYEEAIEDGILHYPIKY